MNSQNVVVLGASPKTDRYSYKAVQQLVEHGHRVLPVNPVCETICEQQCYKTLDAISSPVDTLTVYVGADKSTELLGEILKLNPRRIIMNPGAENSLLAEKAKEHHIDVVEGCTLVMLRTQQF